MRDHFWHPRHAGKLNVPGARTGTAGSRRQGTLVCFELVVQAGHVTAVGYRVFGSPYAIAGCSVMAELIVGRGADVTHVMRGRELASLLDFPTEQIGVALLIENAIKAALDNTGEADIVSTTREATNDDDYTD